VKNGFAPAKVRWQNNTSLAQASSNIARHRPGIRQEQKCTSVKKIKRLLHQAQTKIAH